MEWLTSIPPHKQITMEINTAMMQQILRMSESYAEILTELRQVKKELAELKGEKINRPVVSKTKYPHMNIILHDRLTFQTPR